MEVSQRCVNILVTADENYIPQLNIMLFSLLENNKSCSFQIFLLHSSLSEEQVQSTKKILGDGGKLHLIQVNDEILDNAPTSSRYPKEIYYRIFAAQYLPDTLDRVLYLDPDIIINGSILPLYETEMGKHYFAAACHIGAVLQRFNKARLNMDKEAPYINSGVMLMNLPLLRAEQSIQTVIDFIQKRAMILMLPDQDIISALYGSRILELDTFRYNMTERLFTRYGLIEKQMDFDWVCENSVIIHYCGRNKPWKPMYQGKLDVFYKETLASIGQVTVEEKSE